GHAIVAYFSEGADPLRKVSIVPRGRALGVTMQSPTEDRFNYSRHYLKGRLAVLMGGRTAEELVFNEMTTGAQNDLKEATSLARRMVGLWGMSPEVGSIYLGTGEEHVFLGREMGQERDISQDLLDRADRAIQSLVTEGKNRAKQILTQYREKLDELATALITDETIDAVRIAELLGVPAVPAGAPVASAE
ncbi:MAG TPA: cell division protein FtsH, partial [Nitrolancea sp.]|nr:cell division protein FtsH [Nitrolancea sp.]